jgi:flagellar biosynthesis protein FlhG
MSINKKVIAIASGKGGVGKTWLTTTIASVLANSGRKVLVFDGDIGLANVDVQLGISPDIDLSHVFSGKASLKQAVIEYKAGKFDVIAGRSGSGSLHSIRPERIAELEVELEALAKDYDFVLLDLGAGVETQVQALAKLAKKCLVVITDEPTSLTDAYAFIKILRMWGAAAPEVEVVVNMAENAREGMKTFGAIKNACETFLKFAPKLAGVIRKDPKVKRTIQQQKPLLETAPRTIAIADVAALSAKLMSK